MAAVKPIMRATGRDLASTLFGLVLIPSSGCGDFAAPTTGAIGVSVTTVGADVDPDGYIVWVDHRPIRVVGVNAATKIASLAPGNYLVRLDGLALNCSVSGTNPRSVAVTAGATANASFSISCAGPTQIAFVDVANDNADIFVINSNGTGFTRLTTHPAQDLDPAWSPDGSRIAFTSERDGNFEIYAMNAGGSNLVRLTGVTASDYRPAWSPDGSRIAFVSERDGNSEIYVMKADGTSPSRITSSGASDGNPAWSPDGSRIAFQSDRDGNHAIYVMNADGSGLVRLTSSNMRGLQPAWSPDGTRIAFTGGVSVANDIFVMNADGSGLTQLTALGGVSDPAWSADGRIAFSFGDCDFYSFGCFGDILIVRGTSGPVYLTRQRQAYDPAWRP